jgi:hypothetical protein
LEDVVVVVMVAVVGVMGMVGVEVSGGIYSGRGGADI